ncbi:hypothetical protein HPA78_00480 [Streptococcus suis]|uniref:hypothetical protein n=1 Tax=Streptococcus suis TaxID=1307 RepID=UPI000679A052|nr:hypothetical protein [Streptococcus suis]MBS7850319.1 hypothetical protein [Streptococcus suis]NQM70453.1 hypothetical protein [Streptococcus suis]NRH12807.1 hypothetical protein [Streptococcus suis]CYX76590.1 Uncharacterised protein [Streptococcus suis]CYY52950.1 Uncharacterised protein [Streptococcus suis]
MTKLIGFGRCFGKTTMAILESHATGNQIICANNRIAKHTSDYARQLGYTIPQPISINNRNLKEVTSNLNRAGLGVVVDDVEMVLRALLGCQIDTITFDSPNVISTEDRYVEEIAELKKELAACYREKEEDQAIIETLKDKCVDLMLENADYVWDEIARETAKQRANTRKWRAK